MVTHITQSLLVHVRALETCPSPDEKKSERVPFLSVHVIAVTRRVIDTRTTASKAQTRNGPITALNFAISETMHSPVGSTLAPENENGVVKMMPRVVRTHRIVNRYFALLERENTPLALI